MTIDEYLATYKIRAADLARATGLSEAAISRYRSYERFPRREEFRAIILATGGKVTPNDFLHEDIALAKYEAQKQKGQGHTPRKMGERVFRFFAGVEG